MKLRPVLTALACITVSGALLFPGRLHGFEELFGFSNPGNPLAALVEGRDGNFYGTTTGDGASGCGTVFKMTPSGVLTTLVSFNGGNGSNPQAALVQGTDGNFYGTTASGGAKGCGTVFKMTPAGALTTVVSFNGANGSDPVGSLVQGNDGNFYGTTYTGGTSNNGTVFQMTPAGVLTTVASFTGANGSNPQAGLAQGSDGNFYGTTAYGGTNGDYGTVFKVSPNGALTSLYSFTRGGDGCYPQAGLVQGRDGNFYGTTGYAAGGNRFPGSIGTVFQITPAGLLTTLVSFNLTNGANPRAALLLGADGNFYGTTAGGQPLCSGFLGYGTVFKMTPAGSLTTLVSFTGTNGANPQAALVQGSDGGFYGTTSYSGGLTGDATPWDGFGCPADGSSLALNGDGKLATVFKLTPAGALTTLVSFISTNGYDPNAGLVQGSDGNFYGTTTGGGASNNGTVFKMTPVGVLATLVSFDGANGSVPVAALVQGSDGDFYGTTYSGGASNLGTVFRMSADGLLTTLVSFDGSNGSNPHAPLVQGGDGNFYGTTLGGGTVFQMTPGGVLTTLVSFNDGNGSSPYSGLVQGSDGNFYGTTGYGGAGFGGTVFKMTPAGVLTTLVSFQFEADGIAPQEAGLVQGSNGDFYGITSGGGAAGDGTVFKMTPAGARTTLASFTYWPNAVPCAALVQGSDGNFYGTTYYDSLVDTVEGYRGYYGTVFKMTPAGVLTTLVSFNGANGNGPQGGLVQGRDGNFYGTTDTGGSRGGGNIFRITSRQSPPPMNATTAGNRIIISWPEDYPAFNLQTTSSLNPPVNWLEATDSPVLLNGQFTVTNSLSGTKFYRLRY